MKNSADLGGCYPPRPSASVDNTLLDLQNSSYPSQPHSIIAKYFPIFRKVRPSFFRVIVTDLQITNLKYGKYDITSEKRNNNKRVNDRAK